MLVFVLNISLGGRREETCLNVHTVHRWSQSYHPTITEHINHNDNNNAFHAIP